ncbi:MAG: hypothetical protein K2N60_03615 [Oscillospiraceae bacterium]|nr:hypothetical protein [Oscillospiraceae bacterium]
MNDKLTIVKKYIDKHDYYSLLKHGAPDNEYLSEAVEISDLISSDSSAEQIAEVIASVMQKYFGNNIKPEQYSEFAQEIKSEL